MDPTLLMADAAAAMEPQVLVPVQARGGAPTPRGATPTPTLIRTPGSRGAPRHPTTLTPPTPATPVCARSYRNGQKPTSARKMKARMKNVTQLRLLGERGRRAEKRARANAAARQARMNNLRNQGINHPAAIDAERLRRAPDKRDKSAAARRQKRFDFIEKDQEAKTRRQVAGLRQKEQRLWVAWHVHARLGCTNPDGTRVTKTQAYLSATRCTSFKVVKYVRQHYMQWLESGAAKPVASGSGVKWLLEDPDLAAHMREFVLANAQRKGAPNMTIDDFTGYLNQIVDLQARGGAWKGKPLTVRTGATYLHRLGFKYASVSRQVYADGHDRDDVIATRKRVFAPDGVYQRAVRCLASEDAETLPAAALPELWRPSCGPEEAAAAAVKGLKPARRRSAGRGAGAGAPASTSTALPKFGEAAREEQEADAAAAKRAKYQELLAGARLTRMQEEDPDAYAEYRRTHPPPPPPRKWPYIRFDVAPAALLGSRQRTEKYIYKEVHKELILVRLHPGTVCCGTRNNTCGVEGALRHCNFCNSCYHEECMGAEASDTTFDNWACHSCVLEFAHDLNPLRQHRRCGNCDALGHTARECTDPCRHCGSDEHQSKKCPTAPRRVRQRLGNAVSEEAKGGTKEEEPSGTCAVLVSRWRQRLSRSMTRAQVSLSPRRSCAPRRSAAAHAAESG